MLDVHNADLDKGLDKLSSIQRFIFEYGRFILLWNDFDLLLEVLIWHLRTKVFNEMTRYSTIYREVNSMRMREKRSEVIHSLRRANKQDVIQALNKVYDVADRNGWVHGVIIRIGQLTPNGLLRFNPKNDERRLPHITNVKLDTLPFEEFREALNEFEKLVMEEFEITGNTCFEYLISVATENTAQIESRPSPKSAP
jgi:hypothetical protein